MAPAVEADRAESDDRLPVITIISPAEGETVESSTLSLPFVVQVKDDQQLWRVYADVAGGNTLTRVDLCGSDQDSCLEESGRFVYRGNIAAFDGLNQITIYAEDAAGNVGSQQVQVTLRVERVRIPPLRSPLGEQVPRGTYDLLILGPDAFKWPMAFLAIHKQSSGMPTYARTLEAIYVDPLCASGRDRQEKIKLYIDRMHRLHGIKYVVLAGDADRFPVRYTRNWDSLINGHGFMPSDLYYADLRDEVDSDPWDIDDGSFSAWDWNNNGWHGEMGRPYQHPESWSDLNVDRIDLKPEVAVGRLPASDAAELSRIVAKIIRYENQSDEPWAKRVSLLTGHWGQAHARQESDAIYQSLTKLGYTPTRYYFPEIVTLFPTLAARESLVNFQLNQGMGFVTHMEHGSPFSWDNWYRAFHIAGLVNQDRLPIAFSGGCSTARFHFEGHAPLDIGRDASFWVWRPEDDPVQFPEIDLMRLQDPFSVDRDRAVFCRGGRVVVDQGAGTLLKAVAPLHSPSHYWKSIESYNFPDRFVRHRFYAGKLSPEGTQWNHEDATFRIVPGLCDETVNDDFQSLSFEAWNFPGWFLVEERGRLMLRARPPNEPGFDQRATFKQVPGLADRAASSFEAFAKPGHYIRHRNFNVYVEADSGSLFENDATFRLADARADLSSDEYPPLDGGYMSLRVRGTPDYIQARRQGDSTVVAVGPVSNVDDRIAATFRLTRARDGIGEGFNEQRRCSLEAVIPQRHNGVLQPRSYPQHFLRRDDRQIALDEHVATPPALLDPADELESMAEAFLVQHDVGAVGYVGCYTGSQVHAFNFIQRFFDELEARNGSATLGDLWSGAVRRYIRDDFPDTEHHWGGWYSAAVYHQIQKMMLFGDPSLRIGTVDLDLNSIRPDFGLQGATLNATIRGRGLAGATSVTFSGTGVSAVINAAENTRIDLTIQISPRARRGRRTFVVRTAEAEVNSADFGVTLNIESPHL